jgi:hypothetical protein
MPLAADGIADRLCSIVRDFEVLDLDPFGDAVPGVGLQVTAAAGYLQPGERMLEQRILEDGRGIDRLGKALADGAQVADMVAVVVGDDDALEAVKVQSVTFQDSLHPADADSRVDEYA